MYFPFSARETSRVVSDTRAFMVGRRVRELCGEKMVALAAEAQPSGATVQDRWGRNRALRVDHTSMMFLDATDDSDRSPNLKVRLDRALARAFARDVLPSQERSEQVAATFFSRAELALRHYCGLRGWTYGPDLLLVCTGSCAAQQQALRARGDQPLLPSPPPQLQQTYEVLVRDGSEATRNHVTKLLAYVVYAVEQIMRTQCARWTLDAQALEGGGLLQELRSIHPDIDSVRPAEKQHSDISIYPVRNPYVEDQRGVVLKNSASLVMPIAHDGTPQQRRGLEVADVRGALPFLPLYVSRTEPAHPSDATRLRLMYDFVIHHHNARSGAEGAEEDATGGDGDGGAPPPPSPSSVLHSAACVLSVDVLGPADWRRTVLLDQVRDAGAASALLALPPVRGVVQVTWAPVLAWQGAMQGFFEWVHTNALGGGWRHRMDATTTRDRATRMLWWTALVHALDQSDAIERGAPPPPSPRGRGKKRTWTVVPDMCSGGGGASGALAAGRGRLPHAHGATGAQAAQTVPGARRRRTLAMLMDLQMALSVPDGVEVSNMPGALDAPFGDVWRATRALSATSLDTSEKRDWLKEVLCCALVSLSTELHAALALRPAAAGSPSL